MTLGSLLQGEFIILHEFWDRWNDAKPFQIYFCWCTPYGFAFADREPLKVYAVYPQEVDVPEGETR